MRVESVFSERMTSSACLQKINNFQQETGMTIHVHFKNKKKCLTDPDELLLLQKMRAHLLPHHVGLVGKFLPTRVVDEAKKNFHRTRCHTIKKQIHFLTEAIQQIQEYDPFYLTMDDVHESDMMLSDLMLRRMYYEELLRA